MVSFDVMVRSDCRGYTKITEEIGIFAVSGHISENSLYFFELRLTICIEQLPGQQEQGRRQDGTSFRFTVINYREWPERLQNCKTQEILLQALARADDGSRALNFEMRKSNKQTFKEQESTHSTSICSMIFRRGVRNCVLAVPPLPLVFTSSHSYPNDSFRISRHHRVSRDTIHHNHAICSSSALDCEFECRQNSHSFLCQYEHEYHKRLHHWRWADR